MKDDYEKLPIGDKLNFCERAISLITNDMTWEIEKLQLLQKRESSAAQTAWREGDITEALGYEKVAKGAAMAIQSLKQIQHNFHCWQDYSSTPDELLAFPLNKS